MVIMQSSYKCAHCGRSISELAYKRDNMITLKQIITNSGLSTRQWAIKNGEHDNQVRRWLAADAVYINGVRYLRDSKQPAEGDQHDNDIIEHKTVV